MKRIHLLLLVTVSILFAAPVTTRAQITAPFAIGVRGCPDGGGLNLRYFINENFALEGQANYSGGTEGGSGVSKMGVVMAEYHVLLGDARFRLFFGAGAHYGTWERYKDQSKPENLFGLDVIGGVEYVFTSIPVGISIDAKPSFNYVSNITSFPNNTWGLSIRYYFGRWETYDDTKEDHRE